MFSKRKNFTAFFSSENVLQLVGGNSLVVVNWDIILNVKFQFCCTMFFVLFLDMLIEPAITIGPEILLYYILNF